MVEHLAATSTFQVDGVVHSAGYPVAGATITVFAAGEAEDQAAAQRLSELPLTSDDTGAFQSPRSYSCTDPSTIVYVVAAGGQVQGWEKNAGIGLLAVLGTCGSLAGLMPLHVDVTEQSTVAAVWPMAPYARDAKHIGFASLLNEQLTESAIRSLQDSLSHPHDDRAVRTLNAAANALSSCVESSGGRAGDGSACGTLYATATTAGHEAPVDTLQAIIAVAQRAREPLPQLYQLAAAQPAFHPALSFAPTNWELSTTPDADQSGGSEDTVSTSASSSKDTLSAATVSKRTVELLMQSKNTSIGGEITATVRLATPRKSAVTFDIDVTPSNILTASTAKVTLAPGQLTTSVTLKGLHIGTAAVQVTGAGYNTAETAVQVWPAPIPRSFFGMTVKNYWDVMPAISFGTTRSWDAGDESSADDISWSHLNPSPGVYAFDRLDRFIAINESRQADIIYTFGRTPQWASSNPNKSTPYGPGQCAPPRDIADWDAYVSAIVQHAGGHIRYWELWNEPNSQDFYCGDMPTLVTMAQHAYRIIKGIDPGATVLSPAMTSSAGPSWLGYFLWLGGNKYVDTIAFHGYASTQAEDIQSVVKSYRFVMANNGVSDLPLWDTEASWAGDGNLPAPCVSAQTAFLAKYYLLQRSLGVDRFVWYAYDGGNTWGGLWSQGGGASQAATAYASVYSWMVGQVLTTPCSEDATGLWRCGLTDPATGDVAYIVWSAVGTQQVQLRGRNITVETLAHDQHAVSQILDVAENPVLLRGTDGPPIATGRM